MERMQTFATKFVLNTILVPSLLYLSFFSLGYFFDVNLFLFIILDSQDHKVLLVWSFSHLL